MQMSINKTIVFLDEIPKFLKINETGIISQLLNNLKKAKKVVDRNGYLK
jgi:hypothetical protein